MISSKTIKHIPLNMTTVHKVPERFTWDRKIMSWNSGISNGQPSGSGSRST